jgi:hypothetical protein
MNKPFIISAALNVVLLVLLCTSIAVGIKVHRADCPPVTESTVITYRDSVIAVRDTAMKPVFNKASVRIRHTEDHSAKAMELGSCETLSGANCADTNFYCVDTLVPNHYRAEAHATVTGNEVVDWKVNYVNLTPETIRMETVTTTVVEHPRSAMFQVYAGAFGLGKENYWGLGLKADVVIADRFMIGYGFDAKNLTHQGELLMKINFKKK